ncbi:MAG: glycogen debranching protein GlgX [Roseobacter sp.]
MLYHLSAGHPFRMGAQADEDGVNFAVFSAHATQIDLCLFDESGTRETARIPLPERSGDIWHGRLDGIKAGAVYGYRAHGAYSPPEGHRFNPNKLLIDPYTNAFQGVFTNHPATLGYIEKDAAADLSFDPRDSAPYVAKSVVSDPSHFSRGEQRLNHDWSDMLIYEAHVKGLTQQNGAVPENVRGTYEGLASDAMLDHLCKMGVSAIELLPVHAFLNDDFLLKKKLVNYWGYSTIGFFAPEPRYFGPAGIAGFRDMVRRFHSAGIEVLLDVVYNHTAEGDQRGPTLSFRGLDNASYYSLLEDDPRFYVNDTGTGNTLNVAHPNVLRLVTDSLRFWVECMGVDGFRFDLATTLGREAHGFDPHGGFFDALRQDPVLSGVKMIAEPWDLGPGGYQLGGFPAEFAEWNDAYRDTVRQFWKGGLHSAKDLGTRLLGSAAEFDHSGRRSSSSVNFLAAHDGFTLSDITRYARRHNEANREQNRDGHADNHSDNCGVEGATQNARILAQRARRQRNMLATLFLSQGTPMLLAGDEMGNSQSGNNNAYCQDNPTAWVDWGADTDGKKDFVAHLSAFRRAHPALRQTRFLHGAARASDDLPDVSWHSPSGEGIDWSDPELGTLCVLLRGSAEARIKPAQNDAVFVIIHRPEAALDVVIPTPRPGWKWMLGLDTAQPVQVPRLVESDRVQLDGAQVVALFEVEVPHGS